MVIFKQAGVGHCWAAKEFQFLIFVVILLPGSSWVLCQNASAQTVPNFPAQQNPGLLSPSLRDDFNPEVTNHSSAEEPEEIKLELPEIAHPGANQSPIIPISRIVVTGSTLFDERALRQIVSTYESRNLTLSQLNEAAEAISALYRDEGYLTSQAFIPPQDIVNGVMQIQVREGRIGKIQIEGNKFYRPRLIARALHQESGQLLNLSALAQDLNHSNRLYSGYKLHVSLSPGLASGETNLKFQVAERQPFQLSPTYDNQGRPLIGMYRYGLEFRNDSLTGWGDRLSGQVISAAGTRMLNTSYAFPVNRFGTELRADFAYSRVNVDLRVPNPPAIIGHAYSYGIGINQPLNHSRSWTLDVGANWRSVDTFFEDEQTDDVEIRSLSAGLTFNKTDRWGRTYNRLQGTMGLNVWNANTQFWKLENYFTRVFTLPRRNTIIVRAYGQLTPDALPSPEQFQIGGAFSVRGYTEGLLIGDRGYNFSIEHRFPVPALKVVNPWLDKRLQMAWFYDLGRVWTDRENPNFIAGQTDSAERSWLQSVGVGLRAQLNQYLQGFLDVGFGLEKRTAVEPLSQPVARVHFGIRSDLLPEGYRVHSPKLARLQVPKVSLNRP